MKWTLSIVIIFSLQDLSVSFPEQGVWDIKLTQNQNMGSVYKSLYKDSIISVKVSCQSVKTQAVKVGWTIRETQCWEEYLFLQDPSVDTEIIKRYYENPDFIIQELGYNETSYFKGSMEHDCRETFIVAPDKEAAFQIVSTRTEEQPPKAQAMSRKRRETNMIGKDSHSDMTETMTQGNDTRLGPSQGLHTPKTEHPVAKMPHDGIYLLIISLESDSSEFNAVVHVEMRTPYGFLSAVDWPLLPFYGVMCFMYVGYGLAWLIVCFLQWKDLLRIQFWIGGVIFLGMIEKAVYYAEFQSINSSGTSVPGAAVFAELISCAKRTLSRMLVIIVSLGFGIVKPRLGSMLHRVVGVGVLYFILASVEGSLRVIHPKNDPSSQALLASVPLAVLDAAICWWIFSSLVQTLRTLKLRRNMVKLNLYRHFTNTLIFAVVASVIFMLWAIKYHRLKTCLTDWKELWLDDAYWHILFSVVLLVIMILWRPTNNNQRYAFTQLLDGGDDEDEEELLPPEAFEGMTHRATKRERQDSGKSRDKKKSIEDDLKWVEENIPSSMADVALPALVDSDEEVMTAKFEISKME